MEAPTFPPLFRELDQVAAECFEFLVSETECNGPTVEYWRDYFLTYQVRKDVSVKVGMEREWPVPVIYLEYKNDGHVIFEIGQVLEAMGISIDSSQFSTIERLAKSGWSKGILSGIPEEKLKAEWSLYLVEYSRALRAGFDEIIAFVTTKGSAKSKEVAEGETGQSRFIGAVLRRAGEARSYDYVIGPGGYFLKAQFLPCDRESFWRITNAGYAVSYGAPGTCPSCGVFGNRGLREKQTTGSKGIGTADLPAWLLILLLIIWIVGLVVTAIRQQIIGLPLLLGAIGISLFLKILPKGKDSFSVSLDSFPPITRPEGKGFEEEYYCPNCGSSGTVPKPSDQAA